MFQLRSTVTVGHDADVPNSMSPSLRLCDEPRKVGNESVGSYYPVVYYLGWRGAADVTSSEAVVLRSGLDR
jgi:hypothetical protein